MPTDPRLPSRRTGLAWMLGAVAAAVFPPVALAAAAAPPAVNFAVEWRVVPWPPPPITSAAPGSVTVGTAGTPSSTTPGSVTTRTVTPLTASPRIVVRNGGQGRLTLQRDDTEAAPDWVWTAQGQGLASRSSRLRESLWVSVQWPGGSAPAQLSFRFEQPLPDRSASSPGARTGDAAAQELDGQLNLALDQWQEVGRWSAPDGTGQALQLRVSRIP